MDLKDFDDSYFDLGILGGGQLGRMFLQEALNYPFKIAVLDEDKYCPSKLLCTHFELGSFKDYDTVLKFGRKCKRITIEIEHINVKALFQLKKEGVAIFPSPEIIEMIQDKGLQKEFYKENNIPTADFVLVEKGESLITHLDMFPVFQKLRNGGYDGKGVQFLSSIEDFDLAFKEPSVLEKSVMNPKEISVIVARKISGESITFPCVEMIVNQELNLLDYLIAPAQLEVEIIEKAKSIALKIASKLELVGILAVEMFVTLDGEILVNEMAPRPHNSGHHTIEACPMSQYGALLRSIFNFDFLSTEMIFPAGVINLIGTESSSDYSYSNMEIVFRKNPIFLHHYGKKNMKKGRKIGHITILGNDLKDLNRNLMLAKQIKPLTLKES